MHTLLSGREAQLDRLEIRRIQIRRDEVTDHIELHGREMAMYPLTGSALVMDNAGMRVHIGHRKPIESEGVRKCAIECLRWPADGGYKISVMRQGSDAFDALLVTYRVKHHSQGLTANHQSGGHTNLVGRGAYYREVREIPPPPGFRIHVGETYSPGTNDDRLIPDGVWSSWPSHCAPEERDRHAEHEEVMFFVMPRDQYGIMRLRGTYCTGDKAVGLSEVKNGFVTAMPLGDHEIVAGPNGWLWYFWAYVSFLNKTYNSFATDTGTYIK